MIVIAGALAGAFTGGTIAAKRNGNKADIAQYATGYGIAFALAGLILTIVIEKSIT